MPVAALVLCAVAPAQAATRPGDLDLDFGTRGKTLTSVPEKSLGSQIELAAGPRGKILVAGDLTVLRYLPNGRLDRSFARHGRLSVKPAKGTRFKKEALAVDSQGRVLLAGTTSSDPAPSPPYAGAGHSATIFRFLPSGRPDPSFDGDGIVTTDFGLAPPVQPTYPGETAVTHSAPSVAVWGLAVDPEDRPVITGSSISSVGKCYPYIGFAGLSSAFVARLSLDGTTDSSFPGNGVTIANLAAVGQPLSMRSGALVSMGLTGIECLRGGGSGPKVVRLDSGGALDGSFGSEGSVPVPYFFDPTMVVDRFDRILLSGRDEESYEPDEERELLTRLLPNGERDRNFGGDGAVFVDLPYSAGGAALAVDHRSRALLAASRKTSGRTSQFALTRRDRTGRIERGFGHRGWVFTGFGRSAKTGGQAILVDRQGGIVVGGVVSSPRLSGGYGLALARYSGGR